jgi:hypothetical protein
MLYHATHLTVYSENKNAAIISMRSPKLARQNGCTFSVDMFASKRWMSLSDKNKLAPIKATDKPILFEPKDCRAK